MSVQFYIPVMVDFKRKKQKLRFLASKTAAQTVAAIMKKLKVKKQDPASWGLFRLSRQHWLSPDRRLGDMDLVILETLVLCPRKDFLGEKIQKTGLGVTMRSDEYRIVRIETTLGTHKVIKYDFNMTPDDIMAQIVKKDPIVDYQNYLFWFDELKTYLQHDQPISIYQIPNQAELKMRKARVRFNVEIRNPTPVAQQNVCMPVFSSIPDTIEFLFSQIDSKAAANIKTDKDRAKLVRTYGLYIASPQNEHGLVMTPDRNIESYKLKPSDVVIFKRRPKDRADLLVNSHSKLKNEASQNTFVKIVSGVPGVKAQSMFKFPSSVTVQQAVSKASKKFATYGPYGLRLPKGKHVKKPMWLEPAQLLSSYNLANMSELEFLERQGAMSTTPNDYLGDADTSRQAPVDTQHSVVANTTASPHQAGTVGGYSQPQGFQPPAQAGYGQPQGFQPPPAQGGYGAPVGFQPPAAVGGYTPQPMAPQSTQQFGTIGGGGMPPPPVATLGRPTTGPNGLPPPINHAANTMPAPLAQPMGAPARFNTGTLPPPGRGGIGAALMARGAPPAISGPPPGARPTGPAGNAGPGTQASTMVGLQRPGRPMGAPMMGGPPPVASRGMPPPIASRGGPPPVASRGMPPPMARGGPPPVASRGGPPPVASRGGPPGQPGFRLPARTPNAFGAPAPGGFGAPAAAAAPGGFGAPAAAAAPASSDIDVLDDLLGDVPGIDTAQILDQSTPAAAPGGFAPPVAQRGPPAGFGAPQRGPPAGFGAPQRGPPAGFGAPAPAAGGYGAPAPAAGGYGAPAPAAGGYGAPAPAAGGFGAPAPAAGRFGAPAPAAGGFGAPAPAAAGNDLQPLDTGTDGLEADDEWGAIDDLLDFDDVDFGF